MKQPYVFKRKSRLLYLFLMLFFLAFNDQNALAQEPNQKTEKQPKSVHFDKVDASSDVGPDQLVNRIFQIQELFRRSGIESPSENMAVQIRSRCPKIIIPPTGWPEQKQLRAIISLNIEQGQNYLDLLMSFYNEMKQSGQK